MSSKSKRAEINKAYYERQRGFKPPKKAPKSGSERAREYRARKKAKKALLHAAKVGALTESSDIPTVAPQELPEPMDQEPDQSPVASPAPSVFPDGNVSGHEPTIVDDRILPLKIESIKIDDSAAFTNETEELNRLNIESNQTLKTVPSIFPDGNVSGHEPTIVDDRILPLKIESINFDDSVPFTNETEELNRLNIESNQILKTVPSIFPDGNLSGHEPTIVDDRILPLKIESIEIDDSVPFTNETEELNRLNIESNQILKTVPSTFPDGNVSGHEPTIVDDRILPLKIESIDIDDSVPFTNETEELNRLNIESNKILKTVPSIFPDGNVSGHEPTIVDDRILPLKIESIEIDDSVPFTNETEELNRLNIESNQTLKTVPSIFPDGNVSGHEPTIVDDRILPLKIESIEIDDSVPFTNETEELNRLNIESNQILKTVPSIFPDGNVSGHEPTIVDDRILPLKIESIEIDDSAVFTNETEELNRLNIESNQTLKDIFPELMENPGLVEIPRNWTRHSCSTGEKWITFSTVGVKKISDNLLPEVRKSVLVSEDGSVHISAHGKSISASRVSSSFGLILTKTDLQLLLTEFSLMPICNGVTILQSAKSVRSKMVHRDNVGDWRHKDCPIVGPKTQCARCQRVKRTPHETNRSLSLLKRQKKILLSKIRLQKKNIMAVRKIIERERAVSRRTKERAKKLTSMVSEMQTKTQNVTARSVRDKCAELKLTESQQLGIEEMMTAAGKKNKGSRLTENWMMMCMMMHVRSPDHYRFLLKNEVLPLPSPGTIRRYMSIINAKCGFDRKFFELFKEQMATKNPMQRHGIILIDENSQRDSISVCSSALTYEALRDFGKDKVGPKNEMADHGLVFTFKALADTYDQSVAVFASRGSDKGSGLAKLLVRAVICLENSGAYVHAVISGGALTDRKMWWDLGITAEIDDCKPWFIHPVDESRKIFVLSDVPHLIKTIRNRLYNNQTLKIKPDGALIKWKHFRCLFNEDIKLPAEHRACPRITKDHLDLNDSTKMRVRLAIQVFSESMAKGLAFHRKLGIPGLEDCEETIEFCRKINYMFDALNRKILHEGVTPNGPDMEVLKSSLCWLDEWESSFEKGLIEERELLSKNTADELRVTLRATIEMCGYMKDKFQFKCLLTGKMNQDALEECSGEQHKHDP